MHLPPRELAPDIDYDATWLERYLAMLTAADTEIGRIVDAIDPEVFDRTTIVVVGDNGPPPLILEGEEASRAKFTTYEFGVQVPLVVAGPYVASPGSRTQSLVNVVDIFPTVAEIGEVDPASFSHPIDGVSLLPVLADPSATVRDVSYTEVFKDVGGVPTGSFALRDDRYKLMVRDGWNGFDDTQLFDLEADPGELQDRFDDPKYAKTRERLQAALDSLWTRIGRR